MSLDVTSLKSAIGQLQDALAVYDSEIVRDRPHLKKHLRSACIQAFEFTYDLSFKMIKRSLKTYFEMDVFNMTFNRIIREAYARQIIGSELSVWQKYRQNRAITSHTYVEKDAQKVFEGAPDFLVEAKHLLSRLQELNKYD